MRRTDAPLDALAADGADEILGIPGDFALPSFRISEETGVVPLASSSDEPAVGFAAAKVFAAITCAQARRDELRTARRASAERPWIRPVPAAARRPAAPTPKERGSGDPRGVDRRGHRSRSDLP
ncbi:MAG: hypothetical protein ACLFTG_16305 [Alphaproteobacteria bacterium]